MKLADAFPSKWLAAADCEDADLILTITKAEMQDIQGPGKIEKKLILFFAEETKGLVVNKTNWKTVAKLYGDETDDWVGKRIALYATEVEYAGETMLGIRVRLKAPKTGKSADVPVKTPISTASVVDDAEDDLPF